MEIYIEYAFLENFLYDYALLWLAFLAAQVKTRAWRLCLSAGLGGGFALLFPLLRLPSYLRAVLKLSVGAWMCMLAFGKLRSRKEWGKYGLVTILFFAFSFGFGGTLLAVYSPFSLGEKVPSLAVFLGFIGLTGVGIWLVKMLYARRAARAGIYPCIVSVGEKCVQAEGLYDSGNLAIKNGLPICFVSPVLLYELCGEEILKCGGQVCDEMKISTLAGEKTVALYRGNIAVEDKRAEVYFAPAARIIGKEYTVLINARIVKGE